MQRVGWALIVICCVYLPAQITRAQTVRPETDGLALHQIFGESHLVANASEICEEAHRQSELTSYQVLADWVLPGQTHPAIRVVGDFHSAKSFKSSEETTAKSSEEYIERLLLQPERIASPALDLIATARSLGRLEELHRQIQTLPETDAAALRSKLTMLFLTEIAREEIDSARIVFERFVAATQEADRTNLVNRWNDFLVLWGGINSEELRPIVGAYFFEMYRAPSEVDNSQHAIVHDSIRSLQGAYHFLVPHPSCEPILDGRDLRWQWIPYSQSSAASRGSGQPNALWETCHGQACRITGHATDFLSFRIPLRGNFEVECDTYPGLPHSLALMVAGTYVQMTDDPHKVLAGSFGSLPREIAVDPKLSTFREVVRLRATVRDGVLTHFINGRAVFRQELPSNLDPWVCIRTGDRSLGMIKDLRITGDPVIPEQIDLFVSPELEGWSAYHRPDFSDWQAIANEAGELELYSPRRPELAGSAAENLLHYHRPIVEDGAIEYDFFYTEGDSCVYPVLDRLAFLFSPDGISLHTITDGKYNRTEIPPDNETPVLKTQTESRSLPMRQNDWNRMKLAVRGDELELFLNNTSIHRQSLEPAQPRTFGLFHYQDRTEARIKNLIWRGNWPRVMPSVSSQKLASQDLQILEETLPALSEVFEHDFTADNEPFRHFSVIDGMAEHFEPSPDGMRVVRPEADSESGYSLSSLTPKLRVSGDFDITARFDRFEPLASSDGSSAVLLSIDLDNDSEDHFRMLRRHERKKSPLGSFIRYSLVKVRERRHTFTNSDPLMEESTSGSMRIARRGSKMYLMYAAGDSPNYRLIGVEESTDDDVIGVQLRAQSYLQSMTKVVWKNLTIRAEQIETEAETIEMLNAARKLLTGKFSQTFQGEHIPSERFNLIGTILSDEETTRLEHVGTTDWTACKLEPKIGLEGDFDIEVSFSDLEFARPELSRGSALYFQPTFADDNRTRLDMKCVRESNGALAFYIQDTMRINGRNRFRTSYFERLVMDDEAEIETMRMCRRGKSIYFLYRLKNTSRDRLLTRLEFTDQPVTPGNVRVMLSSGSPGKTCRLNLKSIFFYTEVLTEITAESQPPTNED